MRKLNLTFFLVIMVRFAFADAVSPQPERTVVTPDGSVVVRLAPGDSSELDFPFDSWRDVPVIISLHRWSEKKRSYVAEKEFSAAAKAKAHILLIDHYGRFLALVDIMSQSAGLTIIDLEDQRAQSWKLDEFLDATTMENCAMTSTTIQWFESGHFYEGKFKITGPSHDIKGILGSWSIWNEPDIEGNRFALAFELADLKLKKHNQSGDDNSE